MIMGKGRTTILVVVMLLSILIPLIQIPNSQSDLINPAILKNHNTIYISSDSEFTGGNGVVSGSGTKGNPYIIENWLIDATNNVGIHILYTKSYFVIRNCFIYNGLNTTFNRQGIYFNRVENGTIENNRMMHNSQGVTLYKSHNNLVINNTMIHHGTGIRLDMANNNFIQNNTIFNDTKYGIYQDESDDNRLLGNNINNTEYGIYLREYNDNNLISNNTIFNISDEGIFFYEYNNDNVLSKNTIWNATIGTKIFRNNDRNLLKNNYVKFNYDGIYVYNSIDNKVFHNTIENNSNYGLAFWATENCKIFNNTIKDNKYNFVIFGSEPKDYFHTVTTNNTVDGKPVYYYVDESNKKVPSNAGYVGLVNCKNIIVESLTLKNNYLGITLVLTNNSKIKNNNITKNFEGIHSLQSYHNTISFNNIFENYNKGINFYKYSDYFYIYNNSIFSNSLETTSYGIRCVESDDISIFNNTISNHSIGISVSKSRNILMYNNYFNNSNNFGAISSSNILFNISKTTGLNIIGGPYLGGNYWSQYTGIDVDGDGFGDTNLSECYKDKLPLSMPNDITPPYIINKTSTNPTTGETFKIEFSIGDFCRVKNVSIEYWFDQGKHKNDSLMLFSGNNIDGIYSLHITVPINATKFYFNISAQDFNNNSNSTSIVFWEVVDSIYPEISKNLTSNTATTGEAFDFIINCSDNIKVESGKVYYKYGLSGKYKSKSMIQTNKRFSKSITIDHTLDYLYYYFMFNDTSNNQNVTSESRVTIIDNDKPEFIADLSNFPAYTNETFNFSLLITETRKFTP